MFKDFDKRLQRDIKRTVDKRIQLSEELSGTGARVKIIYFLLYDIKRR